MELSFLVVRLSNYIPSGQILPDSGLALSVSHSLDSSPKVGAFGNPHTVHLYAKGSPFGRAVTAGD